MPPVTVMLASGRGALHAAWVSWLVREPTLALCMGPRNPGDLSGCIARCFPDVLLLDKHWLDLLDAEALHSIHQHRPPVHVVVLADSPYPGVVADVLRHRFHGFLPGDCPPAARLQAIHAVSDGEIWLSRAALTAAVTDLLVREQADEPPPPAPICARIRLDRLTPRERQVVEFIRRGCTNREIAIELGIMEDTVKKHLQSVFAKLGVHRRALVALGRPAVSALP